MKLLNINLQVVIILTFMSGLVFGQADPGKDLTLPDLNIKTPTQAQFLKYGNQPINEYNGVPNISIPLYTIRDKDIVVPITLSYNASGIRVDQEASWVGLGWDLQFGSIVQNKNGFDDFGATAFLGEMDLPDYIPGPPVPYATGPLHEDNWYVNGNDPNGEYSHWIFHDQFLPQNGSPKDMAELLDNNTRDSEPDIMIANFLGHQIKFMKDPNSENIVCLNKKGYVINKIAVGSDIGWEIITPGGVQFSFEEITYIKSGYVQEAYIGGSLTANNIDLSSAETATEPVSRSGATTGQGYNGDSRIWKITNIISPNGADITFNYKNITEVKHTNSIQFRWSVMNGTFGSRVEDGIGMGGPFAQSTTGSIFQFPRGEGIMKMFFSSSASSKTQFSSLESIKFSKGSVEFNTNTNQRTDNIGDEILNKIEVKDFNDNLINSYQFNYSYFDTGYYGNGWGDSSRTENELTTRLKLNSISVNNKNYSFGYNAYMLPPKNSFATDYWGYYNGKTSNVSVFPDILRIHDQNLLVHAELIPALEENSSNHSSSLAHSKAAVLEKITYPTGGYTTFEFELNRFENYILPDIGSGFNSSQTETNGAGLRIKKQTSVGDQGTLISEYEYENGVFSQPIRMFDQLNHFVLFPLSSVPWPTPNYDKYYYEYISTSGTNHYFTNPAGESGQVGYDTVTIRELDGNGGDIGRIEKIFSNDPDKFLNQDYNRFSLPSIPDYLKKPRALELEKTTYDANGNQVLKTVNDYEVKLNSNFYYGVKYSFMGFYEEPWARKVGIDPQYLIGYYPIYSTDSELTSSITTQYTSTGNFTMETLYMYEDTYNRLDSKRVNQHDGTTIINSFTYPDEADVIPFISQAEKDLIKQLEGENRLNEVVRVRELVDQYTINESFKSYKEENGFLLPKSLIISLGFNEYYVKSSYDKYDAKANLLQTTDQQGLVTSYIWGYNSIYPVAKIIGATYTDVEAVSGFGTGFTLGAGGLSSSQKTNLRNGLAQALVTTYDYEPLIGVVKQTDPNGVETSYEYDDFNRLMCVKDDDGNWIDRYRYNYATEPNVANADFTWEGCDKPGYPITFKREGTYYGDSKFIWDFGDGTVLETTDKEVSHTYTYVDTYNFAAKLVVINSELETASSEQNVNLRPNISSITACGPVTYNPCTQTGSGNYCAAETNNSAIPFKVTTSGVYETVSRQWKYRYWISSGWSGWTNYGANSSVGDLAHSLFVSNDGQWISDKVQVKCVFTDSCGNLLESTMKECDIVETCAN